MPLSAGARLGPYEILAPLGAGGMGEVYKANDTRLDRLVAIKVLPAHLAQNPELRQRLEREARAVASLNHPHICALYDIGQHDGIDFLVLEYLEGETLSARLATGPLPPGPALEYAVQITDALDKAHRKALTHRDLKPGNIMLTKAGAKLLDFGLAKVGPGISPLSQHSPTQDVGLTVPGTVLGTFQYIAPEQLSGKDADARSDIFAFGAVLYEMLTARKAFPGTTPANVMGAILHTDPPGLEQPSLDRVVKKCLAKDPDERWQNAHDLMSELEWISEAGNRELGIGSRGVSRPVVWMAATLVCLLAAVALAVMHFRETAPEVRNLKLSLLPPEKAVFGQIAVSPDGRRVAFTATDANGKTQLWVRALDSLSAQPLAGTDGAIEPFWSPDSRFVGFFAERKLKKIEASGGPPQTLCDASGRPLGGAWSRDGVIVFGYGNSAALSRVPAAGGAARPATSFDASRNESTHRWPWFLPDGRRFLFLARGGGLETRAIFAGSLDSPERKLILLVDSSAAYSPPQNDGPGHLLFVRERTLMAQVFDPARLELSGEPFPAAESVGLDPFGRGSLSVSETGVVVHSPASGTAGGSLTWFDRAGKTLGTVGAPAGHLQPSLSPDEKRVADDRLDSQSAGYDIWIHELARGVSTRFTFDPAGDFAPVWSPDGSRIVFMSNRQGTFDLYQKLASGAGKDELLLKSSAVKVPTSWSRDGRFLAYTETDPKTRQDLWVLPLEGDRKPVPFLLGEFNETYPHFSPDGRWIAYTSDESGIQQVYAQPFPATGAKWQVSTTGGSWSMWRRDGKEIYYLTADRKLMAVDVKAGATFEAGVPRLLFQTRVTGATPRFTVTGDGQRFLMAVAQEEAAWTPATVVINWTAGIKR